MSDHLKNRLPADAHRDGRVALIVPGDAALLPGDEHSREWRALKLAGYSDAQIVKLFARTAEQRRRAA
jgi:hypothetical protein